MTQVSQSSTANSSDKMLFRENICLEYILSMDNFGFNSFFYDSRMKAVAVKSNCRVELTPRILNKRITLYKWTKYAIIRVIGADEASVIQCLRLLEKQFPIFLHRKEYSRKANVILYTNEMTFPDNTPGLTKPFRSGSTMSCFRGLAVKSPFMNDDLRTAEKTSWKTGKAEIEGCYTSSFLEQKSFQVPLPNNIKRVNSINGGSTKFDRNEIFGLLGTVVKYDENLRNSSVQMSENVKVRISPSNVDHEAKGSQTTFELKETRNKPLPVSEEESLMKAPTISAKNLYYVEEVEPVTKKTKIEKANGSKLLFEKFTEVSDLLLSEQSVIYLKSDPLLYSVCPGFVKHFETKADLHRPISERRQLEMSQRKSSNPQGGTYLLSQKHGDGRGLETLSKSLKADILNYDSSDPMIWGRYGKDCTLRMDTDGTIIKLFPLVVINVSLSSHTGDDLIYPVSGTNVPKLLSENTISERIDESVVADIESIPESRRISVSVCDSERENDSRTVSVKVTYSSQQTVNGSSIDNESVSPISPYQSEQLDTSMTESNSNLASSVSVKIIHESGAQPLKGILPVRALSQFQSDLKSSIVSLESGPAMLSLSVRQSNESDSEGISLSLQILKSAKSLEGLHDMIEDQQHEMEFKSARNSVESNSWEVSSTPVSKRDSQRLTINPVRSSLPTGNVQNVTGIKVNITRSSDVEEIPNGVYVKGVNDSVNYSKAITSGVEMSNDENDVAEFIFKNLNQLMDGILILMFEGRNIFSTGTISRAIRPSADEAELTNYDFESTNYIITAVGMTSTAGKMNGKALL